MRGVSTPSPQIEFEETIAGVSLFLCAFYARKP